MKRRSFLKTVAVSAGVVGQGVCTAQPPAVEAKPAGKVHGMPRRVLGRTGRRVSIVGYPGFALRREKEDTQEACTASIAGALEKGINYYDVAPAYAKTLCEKRMGQAFAEIDGFRRAEIFLACKTKMRTAEGAREELERSLKLLRTDYFDLYQLHCLEYPDKDVDRAFASDGAMKTILEARKEGKIRHIGFSAHTTSAALAALHKFPFDTVMFPINFVEMMKIGYGKKVLELAHQQGAAVLAIKPMSAGAWPPEIKRKERHRAWWYRTLEDQDEINLAMRWTLCQKSVVAGIPPAWLELAARGFAAGGNFRPIDDADVERLRTMAAQQNLQGTRPSQFKGLIRAGQVVEQAFAVVVQNRDPGFPGESHAKYIFTRRGCGI